MKQAGYIVVSGGARGLGRAVVDYFLELGHRVLVIDLNTQPLDPLLKLYGDCLLTVQASVLDTDLLADGLAQAKQLWGSVRGVVNCAGVAPAQRVIGRDGLMPLADFERAISINLTGSFNLTRLAAHQMSEGEPDLEGQRGWVVLTASVAAYEGQKGQAAYAASKGGVAALVLPLAREWASMGIRVVGIAPGVFDTEMLAGLPEEATQSLAAAVPFPKRLGRASEYAQLVYQIAQNTYLNGTVLRLDAGLRMG